MRTILRACFVVWLLATTHRAQAETRTVDYTVKPGDTCVGIATRELGDRRLYQKIHTANPGLGPTPHNLVPGSILKLPTAVLESDATLTAARGAVAVRKPTVSDWGVAERGMDLYRAWRVGSKDRSTAEVTFRDTSRLFMRENTIVIIYGPAIERASATTEAELESGALETRLAAASKRKLVVRTPSAETSVAQSKVLVVVDATKATVVANHGGKGAVVRSVDAARKPRGAGVQVAVGMGSKVKTGERPSKPRPLPPAPLWQTSATSFVDLARAGATVTARWASVPVAVRYRVVIRTSDRDVAAVAVAAPATGFEIHRLPPGRYVATTSVIDSEGFESMPSTELAFDVVAVNVVPPGASEPAAVPAPSNEDPTSPVGPLALVAGSRVSPDGTVTCNVTEVVTTTTEIICRDNDRAMPAVPVATTAVKACLGSCQAPVQTAIPRGVQTTLHLAIEGNVGAKVTARSEELKVVETEWTADGLRIVVAPTENAPTHGRLSVVTSTGFQLAIVDVVIAARVESTPAVVAVAPPPLARPRFRRVELGLTTGYRTARPGTGLGDPSDTTYGVGPGPVVGARAGFWLLPVIGFELEGTLSQTSFYRELGMSRIAGLHGHVMIRHERGRLGVRALAGIGFDSLLEGSNATTADTDQVVDLGVAVTAQLSERVQLRFDVRDAITEGVQRLQVFLGVGLQLP